MCGVDYDTFLRWVHKGVVPYVVVGPHNRKRVLRRDVEQLIRPGT
jgi:predicted site-specific integrase-resolvase